MKVLIDDIADVVNNHFPVGPKGQKDSYYMEDTSEVWEDPKDGGHFKLDKGGKHIPLEPGTMVELSDYDFHFGWQGDGPEVPCRPDNFAAHFRKVMRAKTSVRVVVGLPKDDLKTFEIAIKNMGKGYKLIKGE